MRWPLLPLAFLIAACAGDPRGSCDPDPPPGQVGSLCGFENPEDVEAIPSAGLLLVSQLRLPAAPGGGAIAALPLDPAAQKTASPRRLWPTGGGSSGPASAPAGDPQCRTPPAADVFAPHGITSQPGESAGAVRVAVVGHGGREAIELFDLIGGGEAARLVWRGCVPMPPDMAANDVAFAPDGELVASFYMPTTRGVRGMYYTVVSALGRTTGHVLAWRAGRGWREVKGTQAAAPNGVLVTADGTLLYAETGTGRVSRVPISGVEGGTGPERIELGGNPDNLAVSPRGTILAATHTDGAALLLCGLGRRPCRTGWSIFEIAPGTWRATEILHHDGAAVGAVASATEHGDRLYFGAVFDDRIGVWRRPER